MMVCCDYTAGGLGWRVEGMRGGGHARYTARALRMFTRAQKTAVSCKSLSTGLLEGAESHHSLNGVNF